MADWVRKSYFPNTTEILVCMHVRQILLWKYMCLFLQLFWITLDQWFSGLGNWQNDKLFVNWQIICPFTSLTIWKGQITTLRNIFFMKLSRNIEVPLFDAWWKMKISMPANTMKRQRQVCLVQFLLNSKFNFTMELCTTEPASCRTVLLSV